LPSGVTFRSHGAELAAMEFLRRIHGHLKREACTTSRKRASIYPFSPQRIWSTINAHISPGSNENVGYEALVPVQTCPLVPVGVTLVPVGGSNQN
jgi:hypothetical protein